MNGRALTTLRFAHDPTIIGTVRTARGIDSDLAALNDEQKRSRIGDESV